MYVKMLVGHSGVPLSVFFGRNDDNTASPEWSFINDGAVVHLDVNSAKRYIEFKNGVLNSYAKL